MCKLYVNFNYSLEGYYNCYIIMYINELNVMYSEFQEQYYSIAAISSNICLKYTYNMCAFSGKHD